MAGVAYNQNALMACMEPGVCLTVDQLQEATGITRHETIKAAGMLINRGFFDRVETGVFCLTDAGADALAKGVEIRSGPMGPDTAHARPPVPNTLRQRAWSAMRAAVMFSTSDITLYACNDASDKDHQNIRRYCKGLCDAGFLALLPTREKTGAPETSNGYKRYRLINDTGPLAPSHRVRKRDVWDHNTREAHPCQA
ncbi:MAG: hypothetical protein MK098_15025 [Marinovum sp.]|nr:hypothetical protein [Marinovum sp.]